MAPPPKKKPKPKTKRAAKKPPALSLAEARSISREYAGLINDTTPAPPSNLDKGLGGLKDVGSNALKALGVPQAAATTAYLKTIGRLEFIPSFNHGGRNISWKNALGDFYTAKDGTRGSDNAARAYTGTKNRGINLLFQVATDPTWFVGGGAVNTAAKAAKGAKAIDEASDTAKITEAITKALNAPNTKALNAGIVAPPKGTRFNKKWWAEMQRRAAAGEKLAAEPGKIAIRLPGIQTRRLRFIEDHNFTGRVNKVAKRGKAKAPVRTGLLVNSRYLIVSGKRNQFKVYDVGGRALKDGVALNPTVTVGGVYKSQKEALSSIEELAKAAQVRKGLRSSRGYEMIVRPSRRDTVPPGGPNAGPGPEAIPLGGATSKSVPPLTGGGDGGLREALETVLAKRAPGQGLKADDIIDEAGFANPAMLKDMLGKTMDAKIGELGGKRKGYMYLGTAGQHVRITPQVTLPWSSKGLGATKAGLIFMKPAQRVAHALYRVMGETADRTDLAVTVNPPPHTPPLLRGHFHSHPSPAP